MEFFLEDGHQNVNADGDPDLGLDGILAGPVKSFDAQVLFDPFEEKFDLPATLVELRDGQGGDIEIVGQKDQAFVRGRVAVAHASQGDRIILLRLKSGQENRLIGTQTGGCIDRPRFQALEPKVPFGAGHKESQ